MKLTAPRSPWPSTPLLPVAWGEVFDKLTILEIKVERIKNEEKKQNIQCELDLLRESIGDMQRLPEGLMPLVAELKDINGQLWHIEEGKRDCERRKCFDDAFIVLARNVYIFNDKRAWLKKNINVVMGSTIVEEKSYQAY